MVTDPKGVTVVIPFFRGEKVIHRAVRSLLEQDYRPLEVVVVIDSSPASFPPELRRELEVSDISSKFIVNQKNIGTAESRNIGARHARYDVLNFLDQDDWLNKNAISLSLLECRKGQMVAFDNNVVTLDEEGKIAVLSLCSVFEEAGWASKTLTKQDESLLYMNFPMVKIVVHKDDFAATGGYDSRLYGIEDFFMIWKILDSGTHVVFPDTPLGVHSINASSTTTLIEERGRAYLRAQLSWVRVWSIILISRICSRNIRNIVARRLVRSLANSISVIIRIIYKSSTRCIKDFRHFRD